MEAKMKNFKITGNGLTPMCRLCLSRNVAMGDVFCFSSELGKVIADCIMECAPVQITKHDKMPLYICQLCFTQLKKFHQFQMQAVRSDRTLQRYLQQLNDCPPQIEIELALEEQSNNSESQNCNVDATTKSDPLEINDEFDNFSSKQKEPANFSSENGFNAEITLKSEIKDEPMDDKFLSPTDCDDTAKTLSMHDGSEIRCEFSTIEVGDTKVGYFECPIKIENNTTEKIFQRNEETYIPLKDDDSSLCSKNVKDVEGLRAFEDNLNRTEHPSKRQNFDEKFDDVCNILKKPATSTVGMPYQCEICKMGFTQRSSLKSHKLIHTGEKPYQCDICQMCFRQGQHLKRHKLKHTGEKPYRCEICEMCFKYSISLKSHKLKHTGEKPYRCEVCEMCFRHLNSLKRHKLKHTGEKPHQCDICELCFRHSHNLKYHMLTHTGEKPYQCDICKMCFKQRVALKKHKLIHTGEIPYRCEICEMCFGYSNSLKRHKLKHTGEKPYHCDICEMCFRHSHHLKYHMLTHTGEKPYQCDICQKSFRQSTYLKTHKLKHTGEKSHPSKI